MPTFQGNRKILDAKKWEFMSLAPTASAAGSFIIPNNHVIQQPMYVVGGTNAALYNVAEDAYTPIASPALTGTFGAGAAGVASSISYGNTVAATTIAAASNNVTLQSAPGTINVAATAGFPNNGAFYVDTASNGRQLVTYTAAATGTTFTGCAGGTGTMLTSQVVSFAGHTPVSGTTTSIVTALPLARDLRGYSIQILAGANAGATIQISSNTMFTGSTTIAAGSNGQALPQGTINVASTAGFPPSGNILIAVSGQWRQVAYTGITATSFTGCTGGTGTLATSQVVQFASTITVPAQASAFTTTTVFRLITPRFWVVSAGTLAAGSFRVYDYATNTWTSGAITGLAASLGTDGQMVSTPSWIGTGYNNFATGTATSGTATTLVQTGKTWAVGQWVNYEVRITGGTGAGQVRTITANTADTLTVSGWNTNPDATSTYVIQGNDDFLYYLGNNAVTMYRYSITSNTWTTLSPTVARAAAPGAGMSANWVAQSTDSAWTSESAIINGRRIYSFRGAAGAVMDYYDIALNLWVSAAGYAPASTTFTTGTKWVLVGDQLYCQRDATNQWFRLNLATGDQDGWSVMPNVATQTAVVGNTAFDASYVDGGTTIRFIYFLHNTSAVVVRAMVI